MNSFNEILFIFLFIYFLLMINIPDVNDDNVLMHKFIIFVSLFSFSLMLQIIEKIRNKKEIIIGEVFNEAFIVSILGVLGYTIYCDMFVIQSTSNFAIEYLRSESKMINYAIVATSIIMFIVAVRIIQLFSIPNNF